MRLLAAHVLHNERWDAWKSMCVWKLKRGVSPICPWVRGAPQGIDWPLSPHKARQDNVGLHKYYWQRRWSRSPRVKRSDTLLSAEMKFIFTVDTRRHTQTEVCSEGFELRTKKRGKIVGKKTHSPLENPTMYFFILQKIIRLFIKFFFSQRCSIWKLSNPTPSVLFHANVWKNMTQPHCCCHLA